jgi:hypothetical protein
MGGVVMWSYWLFAAVLVALWSMAAATADPDPPAGPVRPEDLKDNVKARLVGSKTSEDRDQHPIVKFETLGEDRKEILLHFPPGPGANTTHARTLLAIIGGCMGERVEGTTWTKVKDGVEAIFSLPKDRSILLPKDGHPGLTVEQYYDRCYLVSLKIGEKK